VRNSSLQLQLVIAVGCVSLVAGSAIAQGPPNGGQPQGGNPVYQRRAFDGGSKRFDRRYDRFNQRQMPQASGAWFQRPYPYHLDYYKMRYGGSYAPYFGNLYGTPFGTPQVVNGGWGPGAGDAGPNGGGYPPPQGYEWMDGGPSPYAYPPGATTEQQPPATETNTQNGATQQKSESLPAPSK
jgi:hypothetical protein